MLNIQGNDKVTLENHKINKDLLQEQEAELKDLLSEYADIFANQPEQMGRTNLVEYPIDTQDATPIWSKPYRVSQKEREIIREQI